MIDNSFNTIHLNTINGLNLAALFGLKEAVDRFFEVCCPFPELALSYAAENGYQEVAQLPLDKDIIDVGYFSSPLSGAVDAGHRDVVELLLKNGASSNQVSDHWVGNAVFIGTPLQFVASKETKR